ncbi:MAG: hypothetical protein GOU97_00240 [Nanoarchaeota archaeon]|nr:hypothetical protein [Nanoarchaeota archaeon]
MVFGKSYKELNQWVVIVFKLFDGMKVGFFAPEKCNEMIKNSGFTNPELASAFLSTRSVIRIISDARTKANASLALQESGFDLYFEREVQFNDPVLNWKISALHPRKDAEWKKRNERITRVQIELSELQIEILKEISKDMNKLKTKKPNSMGLIDHNSKEFRRICEKVQKLLDNRLN